MNVVRPDLSRRMTLSKSALTKFQMCATKSFNAKWYPRPFAKNPRVTFGSCVDAGVEILIACARAGIEADFARAMAASWEIKERDQIDVDQDEVEQALRAFVADVMPRFDWAYCRTQAHLHFPMFDWGEVDGHPDIIFHGQVWDVKTSVYPKKTAMTVELGMYALMVEEETGEPVTEVGYLTWVRAENKYWQGFGSDEIGQRALKTGARKGQMVDTGHHIPSTYVDDEFRRWTKEQVSAYVRANRADDLLNARRIELNLEPENYTFTSGPNNFSLCRTCEYNPHLGGACRLAPAHMEEVDA